MELLLVQPYIHSVVLNSNCLIDKNERSFTSGCSLRYGGDVLRDGTSLDDGTPSKNRIQFRDWLSTLSQSSDINLIN